MQHASMFWLSASVHTASNPCRGDEEIRVAPPISDLSHTWNVSPSVMVRVVEHDYLKTSIKRTVCPSEARKYLPCTLKIAQTLPLSTLSVAGECLLHIRLVFAYH